MEIQNGPRPAMQTCQFESECYLYFLFFYFHAMQQKLSLDLTFLNESSTIEKVTWVLFSNKTIFSTVKIVFLILYGGTQKISHPAVDVIKLFSE